jgi:hypothetical protein
MLTIQVDKVKAALKEKKDWMFHLDHADLAYFHSKYPELFFETVEVIDRDMKMRTVKRVKKPFSGKIPVYQILRKHGKVKKCTWAESAIEIQKQKQAAKGVK